MKRTTTTAVLRSRSCSGADEHRRLSSTKPNYHRQRLRLEKRRKRLRAWLRGFDSRHGPHKRETDLSLKTFLNTPNRKSTRTTNANSSPISSSSLPLFCSPPTRRHRHATSPAAAMSLPTMTHSSAFLLPSSPPPPADAVAYAVIVLNQSLPRFAPLLWTRAQMRVCADGGANRVFDGMPELLPDEDPAEVRVRYKPDLIKGDMDSIRPEVKEYYSNLGTKIVDESHDQDTTDLHKCVSFITRNPPGPDKSNLCILVLGALGGRFDHEMGNINVIHRFSNIKIILLSDDCSVFLLPKTHTHEIHIEQSIEGPHCGLIPIGAPSTSTTTTGLRWNLDDTSMSYGGLISTSNIVEEEKVTVTSDSDLIWTISLRNCA